MKHFKKSNWHLFGSIWCQSGTPFPYMIHAAANRKWKVVIYNWETGFLNPVPFWLKASVCQCIFCHIESYCFWNLQTCNESYKMLLLINTITCKVHHYKYKMGMIKWQFHIKFVHLRFTLCKIIKENSRKNTKIHEKPQSPKNTSHWSDIFGKMISLVNPYRVHLIETTTAFIQPTKCDGASWQIF